MEDIYSRTKLLVGKDGIDKLTRARVLVCGAGGVGGYAIEALVRAGVETIGVLDNDVIHPSNLNRQILATASTIGQKKTEAARQRIICINPNCKVYTYDLFYLEDTQDEVPLEEYDFIIDAIDTVTAKLLLIQRAKAKNVAIISCMGTGNKLNTVFVQDDIKNTTVCPLARVMRKELKARGIDTLPVVYSREVPLTPTLDIEENGRHIPASISYPPAIAGMTLAGYVIKELLK